MPTAQRSPLHHHDLLTIAETTMFSLNWMIQLVKPDSYKFEA
ncbi:MAG TPA: hypothetical protein V6D20_11560 [Candidatus Obscuribacterales bacterium]